MGTNFDRLTEGDRERELMERVRGGGVQPEEVESHCPPFFFKMQIQTASQCNARCVMCPWPETATELAQGKMPEAVFQRIVEQLPGQGVERVGLFLMNEPLIDRRLESLTADLKAAVPGTDAIIFTNGLLLTQDRAVALAESGMDEITVSVIGFTEETFRQNMGIDYDRVLENLTGVGVAIGKGDLGAMRVRVIALDMPGVTEGLDRFRETTGLDVFLKPVTNRAGNTNLSKANPGAEAPPPTDPRACQRPFVKAYVLYNGDMVLCNCDWRRTTIIGNVMEESLATLWRSSRLMEIRRHHVRGVYPADELCSSCDYPYLV